MYSILARNTHAQYMLATKRLLTSNIVGAS